MSTCPYAQETPGLSDFKNNVLYFVYKVSFPFHTICLTRLQSCALMSCKTKRPARPAFYDAKYERHQQFMPITHLVYN